MPDNTKVLYETPAPGGAGDALFEIFKQNTEMEQYAKKKEIDTNAAVKLKTQEQDFSTALANLNQRFRLDVLERENALSQSNILAQGQAISGQIGQQALGLSERTGEAVPGLTEQGQMFESGQARTGPSAVPWNVQPVNPLAAQSAASMFAKEMDNQFRKTEQRQQQSFTTQRDELSRKLGMTTVNEQKAAADLSTLLSSIDPNDPDAIIAKAYAEPGKQSKDWTAVIPKISAQYQARKAKMEQLNRQGQIRAQYMQMHDANMAKAKTALEILKMSSGAKANAALTDLKKEHSSMGVTLGSLQRQQQQISMNETAGLYDTTQQRTDAQKEQFRLTQDIQRIQGNMLEIESAMNFHNQKNMPPSTQQVQDEAGRRTAIKAQVLKGRDPAKMSEKQRTEANIEMNRLYNEGR